jgi:hypothetical protein
VTQPGDNSPRSLEFRTVESGTSHLSVNDRHVPVRRVSAWAGWCVLFVPLTIVAHELGHYTTARLLGFPNPALHFSSISPGDISGMPASLSGVVGLAGPAVTVLIAVFACTWILLLGPARWAFALAFAAASRFVVGVPYAVINMVVRMIGGHMRAPAFDEHKAGLALGWSGDILLASTTLILVGVLLCIGFRLPRGERSVAWAGLLIGTVFGWALWMLLLGPVLLP